ncbi:hypothetical protein L1987_54133 [Smallanthus sonchifolius]|uniref:Uncharacterized protein n=1 Tax=Smallanthus sonchifolius TaxID=185202 RepID=A0ACB9E6E3_9ASTR|nr:hypothetical protein L1987_54133 [Smallanthus sonchifolius]
MCCWKELLEGTDNFYYMRIYSAFILEVSAGHIVFKVQKLWISRGCWSDAAIASEVEDKIGKSIDVASWEQEFFTDLPNQENGCVCYELYLGKINDVLMPY